MTTAETIYHEALSLPETDRAALAHDLISSLDSEADRSVSREEIERRIAAIRLGEAQSRPADDVFKDIRSRL